MFRLFRAVWRSLKDGKRCCKLCERRNLCKDWSEDYPQVANCPWGMWPQSERSWIYYQTKRVSLQLKSGWLKVLALNWRLYFSSERKPIVLQNGESFGKISVQNHILIIHASLSYWPSNTKNRMNRVLSRKMCDCAEMLPEFSEEAASVMMRLFEENKRF